MMNSMKIDIVENKFILVYYYLIFFKYLKGSLSLNYIFLMLICMKI